MSIKTSLDHISTSPEQDNEASELEPQPGEVLDHRGEALVFWKAQYRRTSDVSDTVGEPNAGKDQGGYDSCGDGVHLHAMAIIVVAIQAFVFFEVQNGRVIWNAIINGCFP